MGSTAIRHGRGLLKSRNRKVTRQAQRHAANVSTHFMFERAKREVRLRVRAQLRKQEHMTSWHIKTQKLMPYASRHDHRLSEQTAPW